MPMATPTNAAVGSGSCGCAVDDDTFCTGKEVPGVKGAAYASNCTCTLQLLVSASEFQSGCPQCMSSTAARWGNRVCAVLKGGAACTWCPRKVSARTMAGCELSTGCPGVGCAWCEGGGGAVAFRQASVM